MITVFHRDGRMPPHHQWKSSTLPRPLRRRVGYGVVVFRGPRRWESLETQLFLKSERKRRQHRG